MKSFRVYIAVDPAQHQRFLDEELLAEKLEEIASIDPGPLTWQTLGIVPPAPHGDTLYHRSTGGVVALDFRLCERILPSSTINDLVQKEVRKLLEAEGEDRKKATKKERAQIKHEIVERELPKAHTKAKIIPVLIRGGCIVIGSSSPKACEDILNRLRHALGSLRVLPFETNTDIQVTLAHLARHHPESLWVDEDAPEYEGYLLGTGLAGILLDSDDCRLAFSNTSTAAEHIVHALDENYRVQELQVFAHSDPNDRHPDAVVKINKALSFKSMRMAKGLIENRLEEAAANYWNENDDGADDLAAMASFDANVILTAEVVFGLIEAVAHYAGGRKISEQETKAVKDYLGQPVIEKQDTSRPDDYLDDL